MELDDAYVLRAGQLVGIELSPEQLPSIADHLRRTAALARLLEDFVLPVDEELGSTWRP